ncbi:TPA: hypothetical protein ACVGJV_001183 [Pseudomonas aeruginosa]|uniref:hypothetical protein n=1 Tax=Pseudomonas aeruginosa TaxID=287 RepID=UPI001CD5D072|nr:hypothetical protein [Pseudomonas aeruginosa]
MREENFLSYKKGDGTPSGNPVSISIGSQEKFSTLGQSAGQQGERPAATSLLKQCVTHLRDIVEALDNIHDNTPHRWSTELDDVHSSAESLLAMIKCQTADQAAQVLASPPPKCATCGGTGMVDDGEITCSEGGIPYENGPVKCVKDCPACKAQPSPVQPEEAPVIGCLCGMPMTEGHHSPDGCSSLEEFAPHLSAQAQAKQAERPEVVGYRSKESGMVYEQDYGLKNPEALTTVAECDRIVGELRAENAKLIEALDESDGDRWRLRSERDAALANVDALAVQVLKLGGTISFAHHRTDQAGQMPQAWLDVQAERRRQIEAEGWTPEHDDLYCAAELPRAAAAYILNGANDEAPAIWPFVAKWWKPRDARSNYVRASALILAEIERLDRAAATQGGPRDA